MTNIRKANPIDEKASILRITGKYGAKSVRLFGSFVKGKATESSDVDILVELHQGRTLLDIVAMKQDIEDLLGRPVHVVTPSSLSPYIREYVLKEAAAL